jgi:hypothetical protein
MKFRFLLLVLLLTSAAMNAQSPQTKLALSPDSPLWQLAHTFPKSIEFKNNGRLIEFCPDNTCDAFSAQEVVPKSSLEDLVYLYEFYFSDFAYLEDWRAEPKARAVAELVLAKPEYGLCHAESGITAARCVAKEISSKGRVRLLFVRYDEHRRNVVPRNLSQELSHAN